MVSWEDVVELERNCREMELDDYMASETPAEARERMTPAELTADLNWLAARYGIPAADPCPEERE